MIECKVRHPNQDDMAAAALKARVGPMKCFDKDEIEIIDYSDQKKRLEGTEIGSDYDINSYQSLSASA